MSLRRSVLGVAIVMLVAGPATAAPPADATATAEATATEETKPKPKAKKKDPFELGAQAGLGYDDNLFNRPAPETGAFSNEATVKGTYDARPAKKLRWKSGAGLTSSFRYDDEQAEAWKLRVDGRTGLDWKMFGAGRKKGDPFRRSGKLGAGLAYSGTFNPTLDNPFENEIDIDQDDEVEDLLEDDFAVDDLEAFDEFDDEDDFDLDADGDDDSFFDEDPQGGRFFNSKAHRHLLTPALRMSLRPAERSSLSLVGRYTLAEIQQLDFTKPSSDSQQVGGAVKWKQRVVPKVLDLVAGSDFSWRWYEEKTTAAGLRLEAWTASVLAGATVRPLPRVKALLTYRYGVRLVPAFAPNDSMQHQGRLGLQFKLRRGLFLFQENSFLCSGLQDNDTKDAFRYQALFGVRWTI